MLSIIRIHTGNSEECVCSAVWRTLTAVGHKLWSPTASQAAAGADLEALPQTRLMRLKGRPGNLHLDKYPR